MLVLSRKEGQEIHVGDNITVMVQRIGGGRVTIGIQAPREVRIVRGELEPIVSQFTVVDEVCLSEFDDDLSTGDSGLLATPRHAR